MPSSSMAPAEPEPEVDSATIYNTLAQLVENEWYQKQQEVKAEVKEEEWYDDQWEYVEEEVEPPQAPDVAADGYKSPSMHEDSSTEQELQAADAPEEAVQEEAAAAGDDETKPKDEIDEKAQSPAEEDDNKSDKREDRSRSRHRRSRRRRRYSTSSSNSSSERRKLRFLSSNVFLSVCFIPSMVNNLKCSWEHVHVLSTLNPSGFSAWHTQPSRRRRRRSDAEHVLCSLEKKPVACFSLRTSLLEKGFVCT